MNVPGVAAALPAVHKPCPFEFSNERSVRRRIRLSIWRPLPARADSGCAAAVTSGSWGRGLLPSWRH